LPVLKTLVIMISSKRRSHAQRHLNTFSKNARAFRMTTGVSLPQFEFLIRVVEASRTRQFMI
ncbi:MAG: hypothetical protein J4G04_08315, partial [Nitrosopumilaceae archaeon]|nr:hypothetical protein [Nitrosopumilaceae archaeon]